MADFSDERVSLCSEVQMYTRTSHKRIVTLAAAVEYVVRRGIPGYFVECGVWLAGSAMVIAKALVRLGVVDRRIWLYDTFGAMPQPEQHERDVDRDFGGRLPQRLTSDVAHGEYLPAVRANVASTRYPQALVSYVCGLAEKTMAAAVPEQISLLRLDTDWYSSTAHELEHLYPLVTSGGVLIVDDYSHFHGAQKAVDEYFEQSPILLTRVDYTGRMG